VTNPVVGAAKLRPSRVGSAANPGHVPIEQREAPCLPGSDSWVMTIRQVRTRLRLIPPLINKSGLRGVSGPDPRTPPLSAAEPGRHTTGGQVARSGREVKQRYRSIGRLHGGRIARAASSSRSGGNRRRPRRGAEGRVEQALDAAQWTTGSEYNRPAVQPARPASRIPGRVAPSGCPGGPDVPPNVDQSWPRARRSPPPCCLLHVLALGGHPHVAGPCCDANPDIAVMHEGRTHRHRPERQRRRHEMRADDALDLGAAHGEPAIAIGSDGSKPDCAGLRRQYMRAKPGDRGL